MAVPFKRHTIFHGNGVDIGRGQRDQLPRLRFGVVIPVMPKEQPAEIEIFAVQVTVPGQVEPQELGQIQLARFINKTGLESIGDNLFLETPASGPAIDGNPGTEGFGTLQQTYLEEANVNAVTEISSLISAQRAYEMNARIITAADQMLASTTQMFRG